MENGTTLQWIGQPHLAAICLQAGRDLCRPRWSPPIRRQTASSWSPVRRCFFYYLANVFRLTLNIRLPDKLPQSLNHLARGW